MYQTKIFKGKDTFKLESEVNIWLRSQGEEIEVEELYQSVDQTGETIITILYTI